MNKKYAFAKMNILITLLILVNLAIIHGNKNFNILCILVEIVQEILIKIVLPAYKIAKEL